MFPEYKSNRHETPEPIIIAVPYIKEILKVMNIQILEEEGFEADDIIGTIAKKAEKNGYTTYMVTSDKDFASQFGNRIQTGTFFMNRCDYLDPGLAWTGVKDTGMGVTLSVLGFDHLTRAKSYHLRKV